MKIGKVENAKKNWTALIEHNVPKGETVISILAISMCAGQAAALTRRLNLTVKVDGADQVFSTSSDRAQSLSL